MDRRIAGGGGAVQDEMVHREVGDYCDSIIDFK
jgi:hypothetical protein